MTAETCSIHHAPALGASLPEAHRQRQPAAESLAGPNVAPPKNHTL